MPSLSIASSPRFPAQATAVVALALLAIATLGRGGAAGWAEGLVLGAGALGFATLALTKAQLPRALVAAACLWLLLTGWSWVQSLSLPAFAHPLWLEAAKTLPPITHLSIALDPYAAQRDALRLLAYAGLVALGMGIAYLGKAGSAARLIAITVTTFAGFGLLLVPESATIAVGKVRHAADAAFPFTSRNTFCVFAGTALIIAATHLLASNRQARLFWLAVLVVSGTAVIASHSRAGLIAVALGLATAIVCTRPSTRALLLASAAAGVLTIAAMATLTGLRFVSMPEDLSIRTAIWQASAAIAQTHLWLGLGSLDQALQMHPVDWGDRHILRAHNIYLQSIAERGLPTTIAACAAVMLVLTHIARSLAQQAASRQVHPTLAAAMGIAIMFASHGLVDFSLYAPTNAAILSLLLGLACGKPPPALPRQQGFATNAQLFHS